MVFHKWLEFNFINCRSSSVYFLVLRIIPSYFCWNHFMASSFVRRCWKPIMPRLRLRWATLYPEMRSRWVKLLAKGFGRLFLLHRVTPNRKFSAALSRNCESLISAHGLDVERFKILRLYQWQLIIVLGWGFRGTYRDDPRQRRSQDHRYRLKDRIWYPNRCVPEYRNRSFRFARSFRVSTRILGPRRIKIKINHRKLENWWETIDDRRKNVS